MNLERRARRLKVNAAPVSTATRIRSSPVIEMMRGQLVELSDFVSDKSRILNFGSPEEGTTIWNRKHQPRQSYFFTRPARRQIGSPGLSISTPSLETFRKTFFPPNL